jgi:adenine-specific DNA-methyltransferase
MSQSNYEKLLSKLTEMFQLDQADLDFGIYRIMNSKRDEIIRFLEKDLLPQVKEVLATTQGDIGTAGAKELKEVEDQARALGIDPSTIPKVKELRAKYDAGTDISALEQEVFNHLYSFFRRYYSEGDFLNLRRYKKGVYSIPYEGEEVKLHWANADQYYIKTAEHFRDFIFKIHEKRVQFKLVDAQTERDNNKEQEKRVFMLAEENPVVEVEGELIIRFEYRNDTAKRKQKDLTELAVATILGAAPDDWKSVLATKAPTEKEPNRTILAKRLNDYTARNTFDYFIHKDLGGFLRRELDFYIKNEVMHLDDIENETAPKVEQYLAKVRAIRRVATKLIDFLAQLEDFQKALWLKKKFVVETRYLVTLDRIPESLYSEIAANEVQRLEWERLFKIDQIAGDLVSVGHTAPLSTEFLKANPSLVVDTKLFPDEFKWKLEQSEHELDKAVTGTLIECDNFQGLRLLLSNRQPISSIYIDPPYNTGEDGFVYKDSYQTSSWLSMMRDRLALMKYLMPDTGFLAIHIDEHEYSRLDILLKDLFGSNQVLDPIVWDKRNPKGDAKGIATQHEFIVFVTASYEHLKTGAMSLKRTKENGQAILDKASALISRNGGKVTQAIRDSFKEWLKKQPFSGGELAYKEIDENGEVYRPVSMAWPNKKKAPDEYFTPLVHPRTKLPCPVPARGWRNPPGTMKQLRDNGLLLFGEDEKTQPNRKYLLKENLTENVPSLYYFGGSDDDLFSVLELTFDNPKPVRAAEYVVNILAPRGDEVIADFFAGSGTTAHAVLNANKFDDGARKFVLAEMAQDMGTASERLKKCVYSSSWTANGIDRTSGHSCFIRYQKLESYDDALQNIRFVRSQAQEQLVKQNDSVRESYLLNYVLTTEANGSSSRLNVEAFNHPFEYVLKVATDSVGETKDATVDLVETFNWLLGLHVMEKDVIRGFHIVTGRLPGQGNSENGDKALIIWRDTTENPNDKLDEFFSKQAYNTQDQEFDVIYVNCENNLQNLKKDDQTWKVRLIEEEFHRLMWDVEDV